MKHYEYLHITQRDIRKLSVSEKPLERDVEYMHVLNRRVHELSE